MLTYSLVLSLVLAQNHWLKSEDVEIDDVLSMRSLPNVGEINEKHAVLKSSMFDFPGSCRTIMFGMGCFWGVERLFWKQQGVYSTQGSCY